MLTTFNTASLKDLITFGTLQNHNSISAQGWLHLHQNSLGTITLTKICSQSAWKKPANMQKLWVQSSALRPDMLKIPVVFLTSSRQVYFILGHKHFLSCPCQFIFHKIILYNAIQYLL